MTSLPLSHEASHRRIEGAAPSRGTGGRPGVGEFEITLAPIVKPARSVADEAYSAVSASAASLAAREDSVKFCQLPRTASRATYESWLGRDAPRPTSWPRAGLLITGSVPRSGLSRPTANQNFNPSGFSDCSLKKKPHPDVLARSHTEIPESTSRRAFLCRLPIAGPLREISDGDPTPGAPCLGCT